MQNSNLKQLISNSFFGPKTPTPTASVGVQAKAPIVTPTSNTIAKNQVKTTTASPSFNIATLAQQKALNAKGAGLTEDGILGPKTQAAITKYSAPAQNAYDIKTGLLTDYGRSIGKQEVNTKAQPTVQNQENAGNTQEPYSVNKGLYGQLVTGLANQGNSQYQNAASSARDQLQNMSTDTNDIDVARKNLAKQIGIDTDAQAAIRSQAIPLEFQQGRSQVLQQAQQQKEAQLQGLLGNLLTQRGQQQSGLASAAGIANSQQSQQQGALGSAAGFAAPQFPGYTSSQYNPVTNEYSTVGGGQYGSGPAAVSNIQSIQDAQTAKNNIQRDMPAIDNQFSAIANYAQQAGLTGGSPILAGFKNRFGSNFATNPAVIGFNQAISSLNQLLQAQGEAPIDPNSATMQTIQQAQQTVRSNLQRKQSSYESYLTNGGTSTNNGKSSTGSSSGYKNGGAF